MEVIDRNYKRILMLLIGVIILAVAVSLTFILAPAVQKINKETFLAINIAPGDAILTINGEDYHSGIYEFAEGSYNATLHKDGFTEKQINFEVKAHETTTLYNYILSEAEGFTYFERSKTDLAVLKNIDETEVQDFLTSYAKKTDIAKNLPILLNYYDKNQSTIVTGKITDGSNDARCDYAFCLKVNKNKNYAWRVQEVIKLAGFNYEDYRIIYED